ncbi:MAG: hypothetical protein P4L76_05270 [Beijerinckiaceae bacterium]|nr:hypothetical protein [Beijerinckiaceae bacterium]
MKKRSPCVGQVLAGRAATVDRPSRQRSSVTNGSALFLDGDNQSPWARRFNDLFTLHVSDLGPIEALSEGQISICRRVAAIETELERMEGTLSKGEEIDLDAYSRIAGNLRRMLETLGIERRKRDVTPSLSEYLAMKAQTGAADDHDH